ncbi:MAG: diguanylate cyclase [Desulfobacterales bacterium]
MTVQKLPKEISNRIGRAFALLFNRSAMYNINHPFTAQALSEFYSTTTHGLTLFSPVALIMHQDQFFIEEEPLDHRINTGKMLTHFKRADIQSISFEKGMGEPELAQFAEVLNDIAKYANAEAMKAACEQMGIRNIKVNHVFYKKITADDEVVDRRTFEQISTASASGTTEHGTDEVLGMMAESVLMEELEKSLSLQSIIESPTGASQKIIEADRAAAASGEPGSPASGDVIMAQLQRIREEIDRSSSGTDKPSLGELADAVFAMKKNLLDGISARKAEGIVYQNERQILEETEALTDQVLIQLICEEYQQGKISVQRLAQILRRLVPEPGELQRLMPKIKTALLEEGMQLQEFLQLTRELKKELQSEDLVTALEKSADQLGISADVLIEEVNRDPKSAAELIYLASEIRRGSGDEKVLSDLLVDYIERVGSEIALDAAQKQGEEGDQHLQGLISKIESTLVQSLKGKDLSADILHKVAERLGERMEECLEALKSRWTTRQKTLTPAGVEKPTAVPGVFEENAAAGAELHAVMEQMRASANEKEAAQGQVVVQEAPSDAEPADEEKAIKATLPKGILNRNSILYILEKEIDRTIRYDTPFSVLMLAIYKVTPAKPLPAGTINRDDVMHFVLSNLVRISRSSDILGVLDRNKFLALMPMATGKNSKAAMRRILKGIHDVEYSIEETPVVIKLAATVTTFDKDRTPNLNDFIKRAESDIFDMVNRLRNIQSIY